MAHPFKHLRLIIKHRHRVIANASHMGIFFHALRHDLSKFSHLEFHTSSKYYIGDHSPVYEERLANDYFSTICQHHTRRNKHHWEYWLDFGKDGIYPCQMPVNYVIEMFCDRVAASMIYQKEKYTDSSALDYYIQGRDKILIHPNTDALIFSLLTYLSKNGLDKTIEYIKKEVKQ